MSILSGHQLCRWQRSWSNGRPVGGPRELRDQREFRSPRKVVLRYAEAMTRTRRCSDRMFEDIRELFSTEQIVELTAAVALENYRARFNCALKIEATDSALPPDHPVRRALKS